MINFVDGPAAGQSLALRRAPTFLRVVRSQSGEWDALDQLDDEPKPRELVFAYYLATPQSRYHLKCSRRGASGWYVSASYAFHPEQPDEATLRDTMQWRAWCQAQPASEVK